MFNLLPENEKKKILQEYALRRYIVILMFFFVSGIISVIVIFPSNFLSILKATEIEGQIKAVNKSSILGEAEKLNQTLKDTNLKLTALQVPSNAISIEDVLQKVLNKKTSDIKIRSFSYKKSVETGASTVVITGTASDRESLSQFVNNLGHEALFTKVNLPVSNLTKNKNPDFTIQLTGTF